MKKLMHQRVTIPVWALGSLIISGIIGSGIGARATQEVVVAREFRLVDEGDGTRATLRMIHDRPELVFLGADGETRLKLMLHDDGDPSLTLQNNGAFTNISSGFLKLRTSDRRYSTVMLPSGLKMFGPRSVSEPQVKIGVSTETGGTELSLQEGPPEIWRKD